MPLLKAIGIDCYSETYISLPMLQAFKSLGGTFVVLKASMGWGNDPAVIKNASLVKQANLKLGLYHWSDPTNTADVQAIRFGNLIEQLKPDFASLDNEQWWSNWDEFWLASEKKIPWSDVDRAAPATINSVSKSILNSIHTRFPDLWLWHYTANWFIDAFCPQLLTWINAYPTWLAQYVDANWTTGLTFVDKQSLEFFVNLLTAPRLPSGNTDWTSWQVSGRTKLPGIAARQDFNVFNGDEVEFISNIGHLVLPPPPPPSQIVKYVVSNHPYGTQILPQPSWSGMAGTWIADDAFVNIDESWTQKVGWAKVETSGYMDRRRITKVVV
jgi:GH25 family lysozyme M1 (1,4-beta-N-acetylmuramidase)